MKTEAVVSSENLLKHHQNQVREESRSQQEKTQAASDLVTDSDYFVLSSVFLHCDGALIWTQYQPCPTHVNLSQRSYLRKHILSCDFIAENFLKCQDENGGYIGGQKVDKN